MLIPEHDSHSFMEDSQAIIASLGDAIYFVALGSDIKEKEEGEVGR